jgi:hypothetical protein
MQPTALQFQRNAGLCGAIGFLAATMIASMVITFFVHDQ